MNTQASPPSKISPEPVWIRPAGSGLAGYILIRAALEFHRLAPISGSLLGKFSGKWFLGYLALTGVLGIMLAAVITALYAPRWLHSATTSLIAFRKRIGRLRWPLALAAALGLPLVTLFTPLGNLLTAPYLRLVGLLATSVVIAYLLTAHPARLVGRTELLLGLTLTAALHIVLERLTGVTSYPFSLGWSEGNRLFNYSLQVDPGRYLIENPQAVRQGAAGRNLLWGLPFWIPNTPIWLHRLWDAFLWTIPYLALGWVLARRARLNGLNRWAFGFWVAVFLFQGPVYTPLILCALIITLAVRRENFWISVAAAAAAGFYAAFSRWTWLPAPAGWAAILLLAEMDFPPGENAVKHLKRLVPVGLVAIAGLAGATLADDRLFSPAELKTSTSLSQPLLWYRLLPNVNYPEGILLGLLIAALPTAALLIWLGWSGRWRLHWLQSLIFIMSSLVFLGGGLVASVKIGGGNNLHNLDMFLVTLALLTSLAVRYTDNTSADPSRWPAWARLGLALACLLPAWNAVQLGRPLRLPPDAVTQEALGTIKTRVTRAQKRGEVLFIDQRQLLTFGQIGGIQLVPEYEKKYMMDRAMAGNSAYFRGFYRDLAAQRFSMIVTEPLFDNVQAIETGFQEENNAWVEWVARPLLCFYAPVETIPEVRTQLLVPRSDPQGCEPYLSGN